MKKRDLLERCKELLERMDRLAEENKELVNDISEYKKEIVRLNAQLCVKEENDDIEENLQVISIDAEDNSYNSDDFLYASKTIGEIVVLAAKYSNDLTVNGNTKNRELVNLILGQTEVQKSKILDIYLSSDSIDVKKVKIDECLEESKEYFECIVTQQAEIENENL